MDNNWQPTSSRVVRHRDQMLDKSAPLAVTKLAPGQELTGRVVGTGLENEARDRRPGLRLGVRKMLVSSVRVPWRKKKLLSPFEGYLRITGRHWDKQRHRYQDETPRRSRATKS